MVRTRIGVGVKGAGSADDDAQIVFRQAAFEAKAAILGRSRPQVDGERIRRARAAHHGIGGGAQFQQVPLVALAAERDEAATGGRDFAVRAHGDVQKNKWEEWSRSGVMEGWITGHGDLK